MRRFLCLIFVFSFTIFANDDDDIFADIDNRMEVDANFEDDFSALENSGKAPSTYISSPYSFFSERSWVRKQRSIGAVISQETINRVFHMTLIPEVRFHAWELTGHLGLPLRFPIYDNLAAHAGSGFRKRGFLDIEEAITPREQDFYSFQDAFKVLRHLEWGDIKQDYYIAFARNQALSIGHGDLMREMTPNFLYDQDYLFGRAHAHFEPVRIEAVAGPFPRVNITGVNTSFTPLASLNAGEIINNLSFDLTYVGDFFAPKKALKEDNAFVLEQDRRTIKREKGSAHGASLGVASIYEPAQWFATKPYVSSSHLWLSDPHESVSYGLGFTFGHDANFYLPSKNSLLFLRTEARLFSENYEPNYFGGNYMLDRLSIFEEGEMPISKAQAIAKKENNKWRFGHMIELGYAFEKLFNTKIAYENAKIIGEKNYLQPLRKLRLSTGVLALERLKLQASYEAHALKAIKEIFNLEKSRGLIALEGQLKIFSYLYLNSWLKHAFGVDNFFEAPNSREWLTRNKETRSLNYGLGVELAMEF